MPRYTVTTRSYIDDRLVEPGEEVEFAHDPGPNLEPVDGAARKRKKDFTTAIGRRTAPGDPGFVSDMISKNDESPSGRNVGLIPATAEPQTGSLYGSDSAALNTD